MSLGVYSVPRITFKTCEHSESLKQFGGGRNVICATHFCFPFTNFLVDYFILQSDVRNMSLIAVQPPFVFSFLASLLLWKILFSPTASSFGGRSWLKRKEFLEIIAYGVYLVNKQPASFVHIYCDLSVTCPFFLTRLLRLAPQVSPTFSTVLDSQ